MKLRIHSLNEIAEKYELIIDSEGDIKVINSDGEIVQYIVRGMIPLLGKTIGEEEQDCWCWKYLSEEVDEEASAKTHTATLAVFVDSDGEIRLFSTRAKGEAFFDEHDAEGEFTTKYSKILFNKGEE